ncbi:plastocyanin-like domain protein [Medicago truncatula]|uniref:Plastocyanin-like domain protein n=2 Tax=Medicago truncatula TaxID=3880 RepID=G7J5T2_MEDTR|nr:plastocyanin-like domain protein [Medicago truncatula]
MVAGSRSKARTKRSILVGDSEGWRAGTNYTQWAIKNSPFQINDTLVFKYPPTGNSTVVPSVYLLPNMWSYTTCEFRGAKLLGSADQGGGEGIKIELNQLKPYYFASDEGNAYDCIAGLTKFIAVPSTRSF